MASEAQRRIDLDELVPLAELRPNRKAFGPIVSANSNKSGKGAGRNAKGNRARAALPSGQRRESPKALPAGRSSGERKALPRKAGAAVERVPSARALPAAGKPAGGRATAVRSGSPSGSAKSSSRNLPARVEKNSARSSTGTRPVRHAQPVRDRAFLDRLAADDRSVAVSRPASGWRGAVVRLTGGIINPGLGGSERQEAAMRAQLRRPVTDGTVAVFSRKGGVGKTTITAYLGLTLATERGGRIVALDGDSEAGSLGWMLAPEGPTTLTDLVEADPTPSDYAELRQYATSTAEGLDVIVGDPAEMGPLSIEGLESVAHELGRNYDVALFDTGAGVTRASGRVLVSSARTLLLLMGPSVDSVRAAERTLAWIEENRGDVARRDAKVVAVINGVPAQSRESHVKRIESHFADRCEAVVRIPWDAHLAAGSTSVSLDHLAVPTRRAFLELASVTVGTLGKPARRQSNAGARRAS